jgi:translation initiation factor IF-1
MMGVVLEKLPGELYAVELVDGKRVVAHVARELRALVVRVKPGDQVTVMAQEDDPSRGRIVELRGTR